LCFVCHHAMYDGVAMSTLLSEVEAIATGKDLPPPVSYESFLREALMLPESTDQFWTSQFRDFRPARFSRSQAGSPSTPDTLKLQLQIPLDELEARTHSLGLSLSSVSQAVWANVLSIATGADVCFGNVMNGRSVPVEDVDRLVAPCFNTVPLRVDVSEYAQGTDLLKYLHRLNPTIIEYQFTPLRRIQKLLGQPHGLFDTLLLLQPPKTTLNAEVWELVSDVGGMDVPLACEICPDPVGNGVCVNLIYDRQVTTMRPSRFEVLTDRIHQGLLLATICRGCRLCRGPPHVVPCPVPVVRAAAAPRPTGGYSTRHPVGRRDVHGARRGAINNQTGNRPRQVVGCGAEDSRGVFSVILRGITGHRQANHNLPAWPRQH
ncbi:hypothetical protein IMZ48_43285, partial [Candidatus Bathyarchaeota archaeon]|nr:hypothetical protein [Candidatus Bathyarchaeota archaeon]